MGSWGLAEVPGAGPGDSYGRESSSLHKGGSSTFKCHTSPDLSPSLGGEGAGADLPRDASWNLRNKLAPLVMAVFSHMRPRTVAASLMWLSFETDRKITSQDKGRAVDNLL